jgi:hypothetical protein
MTPPAKPLGGKAYGSIPHLSGWLRELAGGKIVLALVPGLWRRY